MSGTVMESEGASLLPETTRHSRTDRENDGYTISAVEEERNGNSSRPAGGASSCKDRPLTGRNRTEVSEDRGEGSTEGEHFVTNKMAAERGQNCFRKCPPLRVVVTCVACFVVQFSLGIMYSSANMLPYLTSYLHLRTDNSVDYAQTMWISAGQNISLAVAMPLLGLIENRLPPWAYRLLGIILFCGSYLGTGWVIKISFGLTVLFLGVMQGCGNAILYPACLNLPLQWLPKRRGVLGGVILAGYGGGGFLWDQVITLWINPHNLKPDVHLGQDLYFNQTTVLEHVPTCYILLGSVLFGVQIVCLLCMSYPTRSRGNDVQKIDVTVNNVISESSTMSTNENARAEDVRSREQIIAESETQPSSSPSASSPASDDVPGSGTRGTIPMHDYSPRELLGSRAMWTITIFCFFVDINVNITMHFYKAFGQTFVHNDRLLSIMASFGAIINALSRPVWGMLADRAGFQPCLMVSQGILTFASAMFVMTEHVGAAMLFVMVSLIYLAMGGVYGTEYTLIYVLFGSKNFTFNLGIFNSTGILSGLISVYVVNEAKAVFGWNGIFLAAAGFSFIAMLINWSLVCSCGHPLPAHMEATLNQPRRPVSRCRKEDTDTHDAGQA